MGISSVVWDVVWDVVSDAAWNAGWGMGCMGCGVEYGMAYDVDNEHLNCRRPLDGRAAAGLFHAPTHPSRIGRFLPSKARRVSRRKRGAVEHGLGVGTVSVLLCAIGQGLRG